MASQEPHHSPSGSQDYAGHSFSRDGGSSVDSPVTANDLLLGAYDPTRLHPLAQLGDQLDYLVLDDDKVSDLPGAGTAIPSRGWSDDLCYGTGTMYLGGKSPPLSAHGHESCTSFVRLTRVLSPRLFSPYLNVATSPTWAILIVFDLSHAHTCFRKVWP